MEIFSRRWGTLSGALEAWHWLSGGETDISLDRTNVIGDVGQNLGEVLSTDIISSTPCEQIIKTNGFIGDKLLTLRPNELVEFELRSGEILQVGGRNNYSALAHIRSGFAMAAYIQSQDEYDTSAHCCTQYAGTYMSNSFLGTGFSESEIRDAIRDWFRNWGFSSPAVDADVGVERRFGAPPPNCDNVRVEALRLEPRDLTGQYFIHDVRGVVVAKVSDPAVIGSLDLRDGFYAISTVSEGGHAVVTKKIFIEDGRIVGKIK